MTADSVPLLISVAAGVALGGWTLAQKIAALEHDEAKRRWAEEIVDHDATRKRLAARNREYLELEAERDRLRIESGEHPAIGPPAVARPGVDPDVLRPDRDQRRVQPGEDQQLELPGQPAE